MNPAYFRHIGDAVIGDHGAVTLAQARPLAAFYNREAVRQTRGASDERRRRARALDNAVVAASDWRRSAGWPHPELADHSPPSH